MTEYAGSVEMPTGRRKNTGSIAHPKDGSYRDKNVHGIRSPYPSKRNVSIRSFSLTTPNARYLDGVTRGHKSDVVNRALDYYRNGSGLSEVELLKNIEALQNHITRLSEDNARYKSEQTLPQSRGKRGILTRIWRFLF
jgi:hypothetical protein